MRLIALLDAGRPTGALSRRVAFAPAGARAVLTVEYAYYKSRGPRGRLSTTRANGACCSASLTSWRRLADRAVVGECAGCGPGGDARRRRPGRGDRRAPGAPRPRGCRPRRRSAATTRPALQKLRCSWPPPALARAEQADPAPGARDRRGTLSAALRYQPMKRRCRGQLLGQRGRAHRACRSDLHVAGRRALPPQRGASRQRRARAGRLAPDRSRRLRPRRADAQKNTLSLRLPIPWACCPTPRPSSPFPRARTTTSRRAGAPRAGLPAARDIAPFTVPRRGGWEEPVGRVQRELRANATRAARWPCAGSFRGALTGAA